MCTITTEPKLLTDLNIAQLQTKMDSIKKNSLTTRSIFIPAEIELYWPVIYNLVGLPKPHTLLDTQMINLVFYNPDDDGVNILIEGYKESVDDIVLVFTKFVTALMNYHIEIQQLLTQVVLNEAEYVKVLIEIHRKVELIDTFVFRLSMLDFE